MSTPTTALRRFLLRGRGSAPASAVGAILKGCLESDTPISMIAGPRGTWFDGFREFTRDDELRACMRAHQLRLQLADDAARVLSLARQSAAAHRPALAVIPSEQASIAIAAGEMDRIAGLERLVMVFEYGNTGNLTVPVARRLRLPMLVPDDLEALRSAVAEAFLLAQADAGPAAVLVHHAVLRELDTLECRPNRVVDSREVTDLLERRRHRRPRTTTGEGALRAARRLEINRLRNAPNPGERVDLGVILVGPAGPAFRHVERALDLDGRVPALQWTAALPPDDAQLERLVCRCRRVLILEPQPGDFAHDILPAIEALRRAGKDPGEVWFDRVPGDIEHPRSLHVDDAIHPSTLVRTLLPLLHDVSPAQGIAQRLATIPRSLDTAELDLRLSVLEPRVGQRVRDMLEDVRRWAETREVEHEDDFPPSVLSIEREPGFEGRNVRAEVWPATRFFSFGRSAIRQLTADGMNAIIVVLGSPGIGAIERFVDAGVAPEASTRAVTVEANPDDPVHMRGLLREAVGRDGVTVLALSESPRSGRPDVVETAQEIDEAGFSRHGRLVQHADEPCNLRRSSALEATALTRVVRQTGEGFTWSLDRLSKRLRGQFRVRVRPLYESIEVVRSRPPIDSISSARYRHLPPPTVVHGQQPVWRAHLAGVRGEGSGLAAQVLCEAGAAQEYHVRAAFSPMSGRDPQLRWCQVLFAQRRDPPQRERMPVARIPYGEADLLLGSSVRAVIDACVRDETLMIADAARTSCIVDTNEIDQLEEEEADSTLRMLDELLNVYTQPEAREVRHFARAAQTMFGTVRPVGIIMLGAAFQRGLVPLKVASVHTGLAAVEARGYGRLREAFDLGRLLVADRSFTLGLERPETLEVRRLIRRAALFLHLEGGRLKRLARDFRRIAEEAINGMPGLAETEFGRLAQRDLVRGLERAVRWGGLTTARQLRDIVVQLYEADRGERGRSLTRHAMLPLASTLLIRDGAYVASMALSLEARRLVRNQMNLRGSRGDEVTRRFLNRLEVIAFGHRLRIDFRSSDWTAALAARIGRLVPDRFRGTSAERARRDYVIDLVERATLGAADDYERWDAALRELHDLAISRQLGHFSVRALRFLIEPAAEGARVIAAERFGDGPPGDGDSDPGALADETGVPIARG